MEVTAILLYLILTLTTTALYFIKKHHIYWKIRGIPHDEPHLVMGNMSGVRNTLQMGDIFAQYYRKFKGTGPFAGFFIGHRPAVVLLDKEIIKHVLIKDFNNFTDRGLYYNEDSDPLTGHLALLDGQKWRSLRTKLSPTFTTGKMKFMYPTLLKVVDQFMDVLKETVKTNSILDMRDMLARFTTDIIGNVAFGIECNCLKNADAEFLKLGRKSVEQPRHNFFIMGLIDSFPQLARKLGMRILPQDVHEFFMQTIKETIQYREDHKIQRNDFLNLLIDIKNNADGKSNGFTIEEMAAQVFVFFLGGFETSSTTMALALYELAQNQHIQERLREEVAEIFENYQTSEIPFETIMNLPYLEQVLAETLRKYPIVPMLNRQAKNDYVLPDHPKYVIEQGTAVIIPTWGIQNDPEFYPNPEEFDPERFSPEMVKQRDAAEYLPFGDGPRNCIGMRFGKMQSRLGLASIIHKFRFSVCSQTEIPLTFDLKAVMLAPKKCVYLNVEAL